MPLALRARVELRLLHLGARIAVRCVPPLRAKRVVDRLARGMRRTAGLESARQASDLLGRRGTCLTRSMAIAAWVRGAELVIGVDPWRGGALAAHAWVQVDGVTVEGGDTVRGMEPLARVR